MRLPRLLLLPIFALFLAGVATAAPALETVVLANGDRLSGRVLKEENGVLHFRSEILGLLLIDAAKATIERSTEAEIDLQLAATNAPEAGAPVSSEKAETPKPPAAAHAVAKDAAAKVKSPWTRRLEFGLTSQSGRRDRLDVSTRANFDYRKDATEVRVQGRYLYGEADDRRTTDSFLASARARRELSKRTFAQAETRYESDGIKRIDHDLTQSLGFGRNLIDRENLRLAFGAGGAARYRDPRIDDSDWNYLVDAFQDLSYAFNSRLKVTQDLSVQLAPFNENEYLVKLNAALSSKITNTLSMSMRYEFEYDGTLLPDARESQRIVTSVGYAF